MMMILIITVVIVMMIINSCGGGGGGGWVVVVVMAAVAATVGLVVVSVVAQVANYTRGAVKSLARPTSRYRRTESIVSLERGVYSCAELQVFSCYRG